MKKRSLLAIALMALFALAPLGGAQSASAAGATVTECEVPLSVYEDVGYRIGTNNLIEGFNPDTFAMVGFCDPFVGGEIYIAVATTQGLENWQWDFIESNGANLVYLSGNAGRYFRYSTAGNYIVTGTGAYPPVYFSTSLSSEVAKNNNYKLHWSNVTNKTQAFISAGIELPAVEPDKRYLPFATISVKGKTINGSLDYNELPKDAIYNWKLYDFNDEIIKECSSKFCNTINHEVSEYGIYMLKVRIVYPIPYIAPEDVTLLPLDLPINVNGTDYIFNNDDANCIDGVCSGVTNIVACVTDTAPFIDIPGCLKNVNYAINTLSFRKISIIPDNIWQNDNNCRQLTVLDDYLHIPNPTVCSVHSRALVDTTTMVVMFIAGLTGLLVISKRDNSE